MTERLNQFRREQLHKQLLTAILPSRAAEHQALANTAFAAMCRAYYGEAGMRAIRKLKPEWLCLVSKAYVKETGGEYSRNMNVDPPVPLPHYSGPQQTDDPKAQAAIDAWHAASVADERERRTMTAHLTTLLNACATFEQLLEQIPEARELLKLVPVATPDAVAASVRKALANRRTTK